MIAMGALKQEITMTYMKYKYLDITWIEMLPLGFISKFLKKI